MQLTIQMGALVTATVDGHSAINGAVMPAGSTVLITSNDPSVATVEPIPDFATDTLSFSVPVTVLGVGSTDISVTVTTPDGTPYTDVASLIVGEVVLGLTHISLTLTSP